VLRAFRRAGIDTDRARGALVHGLRHTFATELANADVSVYTLMNLKIEKSCAASIFTESRRIRYRAVRQYL
jgi:integrase